MQLAYEQNGLWSIIRTDLNKYRLIVASLPHDDARAEYQSMGWQLPSKILQSCSVEEWKIALRLAFRHTLTRAIGDQKIFQHIAEFADRMDDFALLAEAL